MAITILVVYVRFKVWPDDLKEGNVIVASISGLCCGVFIAGFINFNNAVREAN
jgi:hypothetical protein